MGLPRAIGPRVVLAVALGALVVVITSCSSTDGSDEASSDTTTARPFTGQAPTDIAAPAAEGQGMNLPQPAAPAPEGYVQEEYLVGGVATSFDPVDTPKDGTWTAAPDEEADYRTRVIVRRPADPAEFSGTVVVEWFNVSAIEAAPDWAYLSEEIGREGHAYVGVSAQAQGVEGGDTLLEVEVDPDAAAGAGVTPDKSGLRNIDPERYGTLTHPGDAYAFDIFSQVGRAIDETPAALLGDLEPTQVIAIGESQSAIFMTTLVNAVHPLDPVFDAFLIHSRGAPVAPLDGDFSRIRSGENPAAAEIYTDVLVRTDLDVPIMIFQAEGDLTVLGYASARQDDTDGVRTWEVAGTAHADAHTLRSLLGGPRDASVGSLLGCETPINTGPHHEAAQAALHHLVGWAAGGEPPPAGERIELVDDGSDEVVIARDGHRNALGGVRNPLVDVPIASLIGDPPGGGGLEDLAEDGGICMLFGETIAFDQATLVELYGTADAFVQAFTASAAQAVADGFLLQPDADELVAEAEGNRSLFP